MTNQPGDGLSALRVLNAAGDIVGVGLLVGPRDVLTCAHVVNAALSRDRRAQDKPPDEQEVGVQFMVAGTPPPVRAQIRCWRPPPRTGAIGDDIAGLVLPDSHPELPHASLPGVVPARLAANPPARGRTVDVFGYPGTPPRPDGAWVEATVRGQIGDRHLQLDTTPGSALRIQPGYSGSPVYDRDTERVVGMLTSAPPAASTERDSYAITAERLRRVCSEVLPDPHHHRIRQRVRGELPELTVLHISDVQLGHHLLSANGLAPAADQAHNILFRWLHDDLEQLATEHGLHPDLVVITGGLAAHGLPSEFDQVTRFLTALTEAVSLPREHVALIPGDHDVNRAACAAYFIQQSADERDPVPPYWPKWQHFAAAFEEFYAGASRMSFTPDEPWTLFEMPELAVVVAGLNSTMADSHLDTDHYGWVGEDQLRWFAQRLRDYRDRGWLRLAAVHHTVVRGAVTENENLRDTDDLDRLLGQPGLVNLLLHGHTHDGRLHRLFSGLLALGTGSAAIAAPEQPPEIPNQYQLITIRPDGVTRHARCYDTRLRRWIGDTRVSPTGSDWHHHEPHEMRQMTATFPPASPPASPSTFSPTFPPAQQAAPPPPDQHAEPRPPIGTAPSPPADEFFERVVEATRLSHPDATVTPRPERGYLRVSLPVPDAGVQQWPVGVVDDEVTERSCGTSCGTTTGPSPRPIRKRARSWSTAAPR